LKIPETRTMPSHIKNMIIAEPKSGWSKTKVKGIKA